jgi:hypothetical protein
LRLEEQNAWLLGLLFGAFAAALPNSVPVFSGMLAPLFYHFFAMFPVQSPLEKRLPWLKLRGVQEGCPGEVGHWSL